MPVARADAPLAVSITHVVVCRNLRCATCFIFQPVSIMRALCDNPCCHFLPFPWLQRWQQSGCRSIQQCVDHLVKMFASGKYAADIIAAPQRSSYRQLLCIHLVDHDFALLSSSESAYSDLMILIRCLASLLVAQL